MPLQLHGCEELRLDAQLRQYWLQELELQLLVVQLRAYAQALGGLLRLLCVLALRRRVRLEVREQRYGL